VALATNIASMNLFPSPCVTSPLVKTALAVKTLWRLI